MSTSSIQTSQSKFKSSNILAAFLLTGIISICSVSSLKAQVSSTDSSSATVGGKSKSSKMTKPPAGKVGMQPSKSKMTGSKMTKGHMSDAFLPAVLVLPPDTKGGISDQISDTVTSVVQSRLSLSDKFQSVYFLTSLPTVRRALNEASLAATDVQHPFDSNVKLKRLALQSGYNLVLISSIDDYTYDETKNQVSMIISARFLDFSGEKPVIRAAAANDTSPASSGNGRQLDIANKLAKTLTERIMSSLLNPAKKTEETK